MWIDSPWQRTSDFEVTHAEIAKSNHLPSPGIGSVSALDHQSIPLSLSCTSPLHHPPHLSLCAASTFSPLSVPLSGKQQFDFKVDCSRIQSKPAFRSLGYLFACSSQRMALVGITQLRRRCLPGSNPTSLDDFRRSPPLWQISRWRRRVGGRQRIFLPPPQFLAIKENTATTRTLFIHSPTFFVPLSLL